MDNKLMENMMLELQAKDSIRMFNSLVERCFHSCVNDFSSVSLSNKEKKCMYSCVDKFIQYSTKAGKIFAEESLLQQEKLLKEQKNI